MESATTDHFDVLKRNGRTFWLASYFLSQSTTDAAARLYHFCRVLDDVADCDSIDAAGRLSSLRTFFNQDQRSSSAISPEDEALVSLISPLELDGQVVCAMIDGFLWDLDHKPFTSTDQLLRYSYHVAGAVGLLMSDILGCGRDSNGRYHAIDLGIAMQLTNIARDVLEDYEMGRRYIPVSAALDNHNLTEWSAEIKRVLASTVELAEVYYESGINGIQYLPRRERPCVYMMAVLYRAISRKLRRRGLNWQKGRTVLSRFEIVGLMISAVPACFLLVLRSVPTGTQSSHQAQLHQVLEGLPGVDN